MSDDDVVSPSEVAEVDAAADADVADAMAGEADAGRDWGFLQPLMSTEPDVSPSEASGAFDPGVPWHKDVEAGLQKIAGAGGMPAIGHLVVAAGKIAVGQDVSLPSVTGGGSDDSPDDPDVIGGDDL